MAILNVAISKTQMAENSNITVLRYKVKKVLGKSNEVQVKSTLVKKYFSDKVLRYNTKYSKK